MSDFGVEQCVALRHSLQERFADTPVGDITIIASPMRRTLQTALLTTDWLLEQGVTIEASADWQGTQLCPLLDASDQGLA